jgi:hypothetical protein
MPLPISICGSDGVSLSCFSHWLDFATGLLECRDEIRGLVQRIDQPGLAEISGVRIAAAAERAAVGAGGGQHQGARVVQRRYEAAGVARVDHQHFPFERALGQDAGEILVRRSDRAAADPCRPAGCDPDRRGW